MTDCLDFHLSLRMLITLGIKKPAQMRVIIFMSKSLIQHKNTTRSSATIVLSSR